MYTTITLFVISLLGIAGVIGSKIFEMKVRKVNFIAKLVAKGDERIHASIAFISFKYRVYKKIAALFVFDFLPSYAYELSVKLKDYVAKKYYNSTGDGFRGRRVLRSNGSVSFFLERLADKKTDSLNHKI